MLKTKRGRDAIDCDLNRGGKEKKGKYFNILVTSILIETNLGGEQKTWVGGGVSEDGGDNKKATQGLFDRGTDSRKNRYHKH